MLHIFAVSGLAYVLTLAAPVGFLSAPLTVAAANPCGLSAVLPNGGTPPKSIPTPSAADVAAAQAAAAAAIAAGSQTPVATPPPGWTPPTPPPGTSAQKACGSPAPAPSGNTSISAEIYAAALAFEGTSTCNVAGTNGGQNACMWAVNQVIHNALGHYVANGTMYVPTAVAAFDSGAATQIAQAQTIAGDLVVVTSADGEDMHIGVCLANGCTSIISNSSSQCNFDWISTAMFQYAGSPYNGGSAAFYRLTK